MLFLLISVLGAALNLEVTLGNIISMAVFIMGAAVAIGKYQSISKHHMVYIMELKESQKRTDIEIARIHKDGCVIGCAMAKLHDHRIKALESTIDKLTNIHNNVLIIKDKLLKG